MSQLLSLVSYDDHFDHWKSAIFEIIIAAITEPLYGYLEEVVSVRPSSLVFQQNRHISRIDLRHTAIAKLQQPRQQQKQENKKQQVLTEHTAHFFLLGKENTVIQDFFKC